ncbi:MAG: hypothetical protein KBD76_13280 [Bacteriovorax sp.]|jgi:hypothetical protein|nr:hypothetical protein [Bacteriovorax sp.]
MNSKYFFSIAAFFHKEFEKMAEVPVKIISFGDIYEVNGDGFSVKIKSRELKQLCPNKRIKGEVIYTTGQTPIGIGVGENIQMIFSEKGQSKVKVDLSSMSPDVAVRRFLREGEIVEAERILRRKDLLLKFGVIVGFIIVIIAAILAGYYDTWKPIVFIFLFPALLIAFDKLVLTAQLKEVLD